MAGRTVSGTVTVDLSELLDSDLEGCLDLLSEKVLGSYGLMEIDHNVVGVEGVWTDPKNRVNTLLLRVEGVVEEEGD